MNTVEADLYVVIEEMASERAPQPRPLLNDRNELWFNSNRHVRVHGISRGCTTTTLDLSSNVRAVASA